MQQREETTAVFIWWTFDKNWIILSVYSSMPGCCTPCCPRIIKLPTLWELTEDWLCMRAMCAIDFEPILFCSLSWTDTVYYLCYWYSGALVMSSSFRRAWESWSLLKVRIGWRCFGRKSPMRIWISHPWIICPTLGALVFVACRWRWTLLESLYEDKDMRSLHQADRSCLYPYAR